MSVTLLLQSSKSVLRQLALWWLPSPAERGLQTQAIRAIVLVCLAMLSQLPLTPSADAADQSKISLREFIYESAPYPECHASTIEETPAGLVAAWFGGTEEKHPDVGIWVSRHVDGKWTEGVEVANGIQYTLTDGTVVRHPTWNPVLFQYPGGPLMLYYKVGPSPDTWWGMVMHSDDHGQTWSHPVRLPEHIDGPVRNKPVLLESGVLLCGSSTEYDGWRVHFELTANHGSSWERTTVVNDGKTVGAIQPTILKHKSGVLQALCRNQNGNGKVLSTTSSDGGKTWSALKDVNLPNPNSGIDAVTLQDGRFLLVYNHTVRGSGNPRGREMLNVAVSDDGDNWQAAAVLENTAKGEFSYPAVIQTKDSSIHITYTWQRRKITHLVMEPQNLKLTPITDSKWPISTTPE